MKIVCLGNEFIEEDCFAKEIGELLKDEFEVVNIKDSFELMGVVSDGDDFVLLDVVEGLDEVKSLRTEDLRADSITSAHDFDVVYVLKLLEKDVKIIGVPMSGDLEKVKDEVVRLIKAS